MATVGSLLTRTAVAGNQIGPSKFVKSFTTAVNGVLIADANAVIQGISQESAKATPIPGASGLAATTGDSLKIYTQGSECSLELGGTVTAGDRLKSDANGAGVVALTTGTVVQQIGAIALEGGASGEIIRVEVFLDAFLPS